VNERCAACGACCEVCPVRVPDRFNLGMCEVPAIRLPHLDAWPHRFVLDREACADDCHAYVDACEYGAIDLAATGLVWMPGTSSSSWREWHAGPRM
jgi:quinone-modifying oxidoreductase subunit QmoA